MRKLLDVVDQREQLPLPIDLGLPAQGEAVESLVVAQIGEHRFDGCKASSIERSTFGTVDALLHALGVLVFAGESADEEGDLPGPGLLGCAQAPVATITR